MSVARFFTRDEALPGSPPAEQPVGRASPGPGSAGPAPARRGRARGSRPVLFGIWLLAAVALVLYPLALLFRMSFREPDGSYGLGNYADFFGDEKLLSAAWNSLWTATAVTVGCMVIGVPLAFLVSRTDLPFKRLLRSTAVLTFAIPSFVSALGWILLLGPRNGMLNTPLQSLFGLDEGPFNILSAWGVVFVLVVLLYPLIFLPAAAALDNMEAPLEQAAASLGAGKWTVLRKITLPLILPAVLAGGLLVFTVSFIAFGPVALLGGAVGFENISTAMLRLLQFPPRIEMAAVMGVPTLAVLGMLLYLQRRKFGGRAFSIIAGKPGQRGLIRLGAWRWPAAAGALAVFAVTVVLPFGVLLLTSVRRTMGLPLDFDNLTFTANYQRVLDQPNVLAAFRNSIVLALLAALAGIAVSLLAAWLVERAPRRSSGVVSPTMLAPLAFPGAILGISLVIAYAPQPFGLSGGLVILFIAYVIGNLPLAFTYLRAGLKQVDRSMEEAARSLGATWPKTIRSITIPLLKGPVLVVAVLTFVLQFRDLESSIFLYNGTNPVIAVVLFTLAEESLFQLIGALSIIILGVNALVIGVALLVFRLRRHRAPVTVQPT
ncbi:MAG: ABC transporter permease subunit [Acidimicrobiia bacterium]|nr:ABC transporter permease subunit [Acidimicrobiia bacterium]